MASDETRGEAQPVDLAKHPLGCVLVPLATAALLVTVVGFLLMSGALFAVIPELAKMCASAGFAALIDAVMARLPLLYGACFALALVLLFAERTGRGLWFKTLLIPLGVAGWLVAILGRMMAQGNCASAPQQ